MKSFPILSEIYKHYFKYNQQNITAHYEYAEIMETIENINMAAVHYREAGVAALNTKQFKEAQKCFDAALKVQPLQCDIYYWLGKLNIAQKKFAKLLTFLNRDWSVKVMKMTKQHRHVQMNYILF